MFFFAGFESTARSMSFIAYELAINPDIQDKLRQEIQEINEKCNNTVTYDLLMEMKYLDMVVSGKYIPRDGKTETTCNRIV